MFESDLTLTRPPNKFNLFALAECAVFKFDYSGENGKRLRV